MECLSILFRILEVAWEDGGACEANLTPGERCVLVTIAHLWDISQLDLDRWNRTSHMASHIILRHGDARCSTGLSRAVAFHHGAAEAHFQKVDHIYRDWS